MKKTVTSLSFSAKWIVFRFSLFLLFSAFFCSFVAGQGLDHWKEIGDFSQNVWKPQATLDLAIAQEHARMDIALTQLDLLERDRAIYLSYKRMLTYSQDFIVQGKPVDVAIFESYDKVLAEAPTDKFINALPDGILVTYIPILVEALTEVPVADASGQ